MPELKSIHLDSCELFECSECSSVYRKVILKCPSCKADFRLIDTVVIIEVSKSLREAASLIAEAHWRFNHVKISLPDVSHLCSLDNVCQLSTWINEKVYQLKHLNESRA